MVTDPNGLANPQIQSTQNQSMQLDQVFSVGGLTVRQYYSGLAMQGMLSTLNPQGQFDAEYLAKTSVAMADLLINALNK